LARRARAVLVDVEEILLLFVLSAIDEPLAVGRKVGLGGVLEALSDRYWLARHRRRVRVEVGFQNVLAADLTDIYCAPPVAREAEVLRTTGGLAPTGPGSATGEVAAVPYTAEYYFYRARD
jgi:hypothetical protein